MASSFYTELGPGEGNGNPPQYSCLENPMNRGAWWVAVHGITRVRHDLGTKLLLQTRFFSSTTTAKLGPQQVSSRRDNTQCITPKSQQQAWRQKLPLWPGPSCYIMVSSSSLGKEATSGRKVSVRRMALAKSVPS